MNVIRKSFALRVGDVADADDKGTFSGTAVPYGVADEGGDVIREKCFAKSIADQGGVFPLLWTHDSRDVLGTVTVDADTRTLAVTGALLIGLVPKAREVHGLLKARAVRGLSVGFIPLRVAPRGDGGQDFIEGRLLEVSLCAVPSYQHAQVREVRSLADVMKSLDPTRDRAALLALRQELDARLGVNAERAEARLLLKALSSFDGAKYSAQYRSKFRRR